jgi:hydroxymethylbilane synthase
MAALGTVEGHSLRLRGLIADPGGRRILRGELTGAASDAEAVGAALGDQLLAQGAAELIAEAAP